MNKERKHPRLKDKSLYTTPGIAVHITIGTRGGKPWFSDSRMAQAFVHIMKQVSNEKGNRVYAYCVMPDHVHILVDASDKCDVIGFIKITKGRFATFCRWMGIHSSPLQESFYDHVLRKDEDVLTVAKYIIGNPVRGKLVGEMGQYPFAGSLVFDL